jgi:hypothetical protein
MFHDNNSWFSPGIKYHAEKEKKDEQEKKTRQLEAIELARKLEEEKKKAGIQFLTQLGLKKL